MDLDQQIAHITQLYNNCHSRVAMGSAGTETLRTFVAAAGVLAQLQQVRATRDLVFLQDRQNFLLSELLDCIRNK